MRNAVLLLVPVVALACARPPVDISYDGPTAGWPAYGNDPGGMRYSPLDQITAANVASLDVAWTHHYGNLGNESAVAYEMTPILADEKLVLCTPYNEVIALDPETGEELWSWDPQQDRSVHYSNQFVCRGVSQWVDRTAPPDAVCRHRILTATAESRLVALDARDGRPCADFGEGGQVDLKAGVGDELYRGEYHVTSPPAIFRDLAITGSAIGDNTHIDAPSGVVRAYDVRTGALRWAWDPLPPDLEKPPAAVSEQPGSWHLGTANVWSIISVDEDLGLVYLPTGNTAPDYWAGERRGSDRYSSSVVALDGETGEVVWSFQTVHHDLWDFDVPAQPTLLDFRRGGETVPALVQATKMGFLYFLDRRTGEPLFPVEERPVPQTDVPGEVTSPTQPFPTKPPALTDLELDPADAFGLLGFDKKGCRERFESLRWEGIFTPPSLEGSLMFPGNAGGSNWGGVAVDPDRRLVLANTMNLAWAVRLIPRERFEAEARANPGVEHGAQLGTPYGMSREMLVSPLGVPCTPTPWGELAAVDIEKGEIRWQVPLGTVRDILPIPLPLGRKWGTPNLGGPVATASGLVFIGAAMDDYLRAFDVETGTELWKARLPAAPQATPMTYRLRPSSRQFVVIAAGGHDRAGTDRGDALVAFALGGDRAPAAAR